MPDLREHHPNRLPGTPQLSLLPTDDHLAGVRAEQSNHGEVFTRRWVVEFIEQDHPLTWAISLILLLYGLLMILEPLLTRDSKARTHVYLALQTALVFIASLFYWPGWAFW